MKVLESTPRDVSCRFDDIVATIGSSRNVESAKDSLDICLNYGSAPNRCGGVEVVDDVLQLFWADWIINFCSAYSDILSMRRSSDRMYEADPKWLQQCIDDKEVIQQGTTKKNGIGAWAFVLCARQKMDTTVFSGG